jgi:hypothetical protein
VNKLTGYEKQALDDFMRIGRDIIARRNGRTEYALAGFIE